MVGTGVIVIVALVFLGLILWAWTDAQQKKRDAGVEVQRQCLRCGTVWCLDPRSARERAPDRSEMVAAKLYRTGKRASLVTFKGSAAEMQVQNLEARAARVQANASCPQCGSQSFNEALVRL